MSLADIRQLCVDPFPLSRTRADIMDGLGILTVKLMNSNIKGQLWVDRSFLTQKINPGDADIVLSVSHLLYDNGTTQQKSTLEWMATEDLKPVYHCHNFLFLEYPTSHSLHGEGEKMKDYWLNWFGKSRSKQKKGIAVIELR